MASQLSEREIAFLVANEGVEQVELTEPWRAVEEAGGRPVLVAPKGDDVQAFNHLDKADRFGVDVTVPEADPARFAGLVLPAGWRTPTSCGPMTARFASSARSSTPASRWRQFAMHRGRSSRRMR
jgi:protease I